MELKLKSDWDLPVQCTFLSGGPEKGNFAGREEELEHLYNEVFRKNTGSILVTGHRGVGKTSIIYNVLNTISQKEERNIFVLLNAPQVEANAPIHEQSLNAPREKINPENILKNLIKRLYSAADLQRTSLEKHLKRDLDLLYKKAVSSDFRLFEKASSLLELETKNIFREGLNLNNFIFGISLLVTAVAVSMDLPFSDLVAAISGMIFGGVSIRKTYEWQERLTKQEKAETLYEFDNSIGNLEYDLENLHREFAKVGYKIIYVIDELDKLDTGKPEEILKYFKNLFTLSQAVFIFVGGESLYKLGAGASDDGDLRHAAYTYFTSKFYLSRPNWTDLSNFIDSIVAGSSEIKSGQNAKEYECFKHSISFEASNDFFDIKSRIRDRIATFDEEGKPIINYSISDRHELKKCRLHQAITLILNKYCTSKLSRKNEDEFIARELFILGEKINTWEIGHETVEPLENATVASSMRDLYRILNKMGTLSVSGTEIIESEDGEIEKKTYYFSGDFGIEPLASLQDNTEYEKKYFDEFSDYLQCVYELAEFFLEQKNLHTSFDEFVDDPDTHLEEIESFGFKIEGNFAEFNNLFNKLKKNPFPITRDEVEEASTNLKKHKSLLRNSFPEIISRFLLETLTEQGLLRGKIDESNFLPEELADELTKVKNDSAVLLSSDLKKKILFINFLSVQNRRVKSFINKNSSSRRVVVFCNEKHWSNSKGVKQFIRTPNDKIAVQLNELLKWSRSFLKK